MYHFYVATRRIFNHKDISDFLLANNTVEEVGDAFYLTVAQLDRISRSNAVIFAVAEDEKSINAFGLAFIFRHNSNTIAHIPILCTSKVFSLSSGMVEEFVETFKIAARDHFGISEYSYMKLVGDESVRTHSPEYKFDVRQWSIEGNVHLTSGKFEEIENLTSPFRTFIDSKVTNIGESTIFSFFEYSSVQLGVIHSLVTCAGQMNRIHELGLELITGNDTITLYNPGTLGEEVGGLFALYSNCADISSINHIF